MAVAVDVQGLQVGLGIEECGKDSRDGPAGAPDDLERIVTVPWIPAEHGEVTPSILIEVDRDHRVWWMGKRNRGRGCERSGTRQDGHGVRVLPRHEQVETAVAVHVGRGEIECPLVPLKKAFRAPKVPSPLPGWTTNPPPTMAACHQVGADDQVEVRDPRRCAQRAMPVASLSSDQSVREKAPAPRLMCNETCSRVQSAATMSGRPSPSRSPSSRSTGCSGPWSTRILVERPVRGAGEQREVAPPVSHDHVHRSVRVEVSDAEAERFFPVV